MFQSTPSRSQPSPAAGRSSVEAFLSHVEEAAAPEDDDGWVSAADLFEGLETPGVGASPENELQSFFAADQKDRHGERMRRMARPNSAGGDGWPDHNYGPAYWRQHARRKIHRREHERHGLWEVDDLEARRGGPPMSEPFEAVPGSAPWRAPPAVGERDDDAGWLASLAREAPLTVSTTARIVGVASGDPVERWVTVCETEQVLLARPRRRVASPPARRDLFRRDLFRRGLFRLRSRRPPVNL